MSHLPTAPISRVLVRINPLKEGCFQLSGAFPSVIHKTPGWAVGDWPAERYPDLPARFRWDSLMGVIGPVIGGPFFQQKTMSGCTDVKNVPYSKQFGNLSTPVLSEGTTYHPSISSQLFIPFASTKSCAYVHYVNRFFGHLLANEKVTSSCAST